VEIALVAALHWLASGWEEQGVAAGATVGTGDY